MATFGQWTGSSRACPASKAGRERTPFKMTTALSLCAVSKSFGGFRALDTVDLSVRSGEVHALLGENGAGKSTLMNIACGLYAPDEGHVEMGGQTITIADARDAAARGIGMVHQHFKLVPAFSVLENILLFNPGRSATEVAQQARDLAARMGFELDLDRRAGTLGVSEQQRLEILKVLVAGARIVILDEPTAVLGEEDGRALMQTVRGLAEAGSAVILVNHKLHEALHHSDRITVMRQGRKIAETVPAEMDPARLTALIVGEHIVEEPVLSSKVGGTRIRLNKLRMAGDGGRKGLVDVNFEVHDGEIYGIAGVSGNGQTELADALMGWPCPRAARSRSRGSAMSRRKARRSGGGAAWPAFRWTVTATGWRAASVSPTISPSTAHWRAAMADGSGSTGQRRGPRRARPSRPLTYKGCGAWPRRPPCCLAAMPRNL